MNLKKNHYSRRALALLLTLVRCVGTIPTAFAAQQNSYHDPAEHWMQASGRTNELDANSVVTRETFKCGECGKATSFEVFRVPEYTRNGQPALSRNVKYSDGTMVDGVGKGDTMDGIPGKDANYTGYRYPKAVCEACGGIISNMSKSEYGYLKNVYWLYDCAAAFTQELDETVSYEYTDDTYHTVTTKGGTYCAFCYGTNHTVSRKLERHSMVTEVLPQPANGRFATVEKCSLCDYARYDYTAAMAVIADYYGVVDGKPHTITVSDLSEAGVRTSIRYGNSADSCTMTSAPNYTEAGQYMVYYEITYTYKGKEMTENGVAKVRLRDESTKDDGSSACGCGDPHCGCHHHHHHADEVFTSWGVETVKVFTESELETILTALDSGDYGAILRAKGIVHSEDGKWLHFDFVPAEHQVRFGAAAYTGPIATCVFHLEMNGAPINSGMGTCGLCGLIGVWTGWVSPSEEAIAKGAVAMSPTGFDWLGLILVAIVLPAILAPLINMVCRRLGWVKDGDLKLD